MAAPSLLSRELLLLEPREVPLGGVRAMMVRRTLPHRDVRTIGPWCFVDHYRVEHPAAGRSMDVPPHPHTGLQTVTWLLSGEVEHRDSVGSVAAVRPGELNLMTAGHGIAHSEVSAPGTGTLHGVQLWVALPDEHRNQAPHFEAHAGLPGWTSDGLRATVVVGELGGARSPAATYSPVVGAHLVLAAGARVALPVDPAFEHGLLLLEGSVQVEGVEPAVGALLSVGGARRELAVGSVTGGQILLLGGAPFEEDLLMWWNFVGRTQEEIVAARESWAAGERFGAVHGYPGEPLPAPALPTTTLRARPRRRHGTGARADST
jgi:redox-sensitive bicupin YhaK (pirin superfamily)